jgi:hypothetical protein
MIVGLGMDVSVNFIISNAWMRQIGAVIDYGASEFRVPLLNDVTKFPIAYRSPTRKIPSVNEHVHHLSRKSAFLALPHIEGLLKVMTVYNPQSPWLPAARQLAMKMSASSMTSRPLEISGAGGAAASATRNGKSGEDHPLPCSQPSQTHEGVQGDVTGVHLDPSTLQVTGLVGTTHGSGRGPQPIEHYATPQMGAEMAAHAHGHATFADPLTEADDDTDLFGPGS